MIKVYDIRKLSIDKFDMLAVAYFFLVINQGVDIDHLNIGRVKLLEIIPIFFLVLNGINNFYFNKKAKYIYILLATIFIFSLISVILQKNIYPLVIALAFVVIVISCLNFSKEKQILDRNLVKLFQYILIINFFIIIFCFFAGDSKYLNLDTFYRFRGIFGNSNQLGRFCSISIIICLFVFFENYLRLSKFFKMIALFNFIFSIILILYSNGRLSLLIVFFATFFYAILNLKSVLLFIKKFFQKSFFLQILFFVIFVFIFFLLIYIFKNAVDAILNKFLISEILQSRGGLTSYRFDYWKESLSYLNFFGYKDYTLNTNLCELVLPGYWDQIMIYKRCEVHSTYLSLWLKYGFYLPFFLFFGLIAMLIYSIGITNKSPKYSFLSRLVIIMTVTLIIYYLFETGILHIFFFLDLIFFSFLINKNFNIYIKNENNNLR